VILAFCNLPRTAWVQGTFVLGINRLERKSDHYLFIRVRLIMRTVVLLPTDKGSVDLDSISTPLISEFRHLTGRGLVLAS